MPYNENNILRVAAYIRVSTSSDDQLNSFASQQRYFEDYIEKHPNWKLVNIYKDEGISGTNVDKREGFKQMMEDAFKNKIDLIITKEVSRFARNTIDSIKWVRELKSRGVSVIFLIDGIDTSKPDSEFHLTIMSAIAQEESHKTSERVKWGLKRQMEKGIVLGRELYGYRKINGELTIIEDEALIIRKIYHKYTIEKKGIFSIVKDLENEGVSPPNPDNISKNKNKWNNNTIYRILKNEKYVGDLVQRKTWTPDFLSHKSQRNNGEVDLIYIKEHHPNQAIISRKMWDDTQAEMERRSQKTSSFKKRYSNKYWCSGKLLCGECSRMYSPSYKKSPTGDPYLRWRCSSTNTPISEAYKGCKNLIIRDSSLKYLINSLLKFLIDNSSDIKEDIFKEIKNLEIKDNTNYINDISTQIDVLNQKKEKLLELRISNEITRDEFSTMKSKIDSQIDKLKDKLSILEKNITAYEGNMQGFINMMEEIKNILSFEELTDEIFFNIIEHMTLYLGRILEVKLYSLPYVFKIHFKTSGKGKTYKTEISKINY